jgi:hypothetical protein
MTGNKENTICPTCWDKMDDELKAWADQGEKTRGDIEREKHKIFLNKEAEREELTEVRKKVLTQNTEEERRRRGYTGAKLG